MSLCCHLENNSIKEKKILFLLLMKKESYHQIFIMKCTDMDHYLISNLIVETSIIFEKKNLFNGENNFQKIDIKSNEF